MMPISVIYGDSYENLFADIVYKYLAWQLSNLLEDDSE